MLEVFGEHTLSTAGDRRIAGDFRRAAGGLRAACARATRYPLLPLALFRIRTFRAAVSGSFFTRIGIGGIPFLFPLLYQVGLGFTPIQSGLLMMPQAIAAISLKMTMPRILTRFGYRFVLVSNTIIIGAADSGLRDNRARDADLADRGEAFCYGFFSSLQFTSMNTLVYADVGEEADQQRELHRQHDAADVDELRRRVGVAGHGAIHSRTDFSRMPPR